MSVEIIVNREKVEAIGTRMDALVSKLENRKLNLSFENSKGEAIDHMKTFAQELEKVGSMLATYMKNTSRMLRETAKRFESDMDGERLFGKK